MKLVRLEVNWYSEEDDNYELISIFVWPEDVKMIREADREERKEHNVESIVTIKTYHPIIQKTLINNIEPPKTFGWVSYETTVTHPEEDDSDFYWDSPMTVEAIEQKINFAMS